MKLLLLAGLCVGVLLMVGCTSAEIRQTGGASASGMRVAGVQVALGSGLDADDRAMLREEQGEETLRTMLERRLADAGKLQTGAAALVVTITDVRVRSTASAVLWGVMAGPDHIAVTVAVQEKGKMLKTFTAEGSRTSGAFAGAGSGGRVERMCEALAESIVRQL